jgi:hypothetical protein
VVFTGKSKEEFTGKDGLKKEGFKEGAVVTLLTDEKDVTKLTEIRLGKLKKKKNAE